MIILSQPSFKAGNLLLNLSTLFRLRKYPSIQDYLGNLVVTDMHVSNKNFHQLHLLNL
jgi:hypothetical protein